MPDIIVTTPKGEIRNAAREAADAKKAGGNTMYFRRFSPHHAPNITKGDRVFYVEDGFVRGFAVVDHTVGERFHKGEKQGYQGETNFRCDTTGREWGDGFYVFMRADSWKWIRPVGMKGFQGFRYNNPEGARCDNFRHEHVLPAFKHHRCDIVVIGDWLMPRPEIEAGYNPDDICTDCGHTRADHRADLPAPCNHGRTNVLCIDHRCPAYGCRCIAFNPNRRKQETV